MQNNDNETALILATKFSNGSSTENTVKMLIDAGADLNIRGYEGGAALM